MKQEIVICDCCGRQIPSLTYYVAIPKFLTNKGYYVAIPKFLTNKGVEHQDSITWIICDDCIQEIGKRVREQTEPIEFEIEVKE